ncbi:MAG: hypothetical protein LBS45_11840 [Synergistaceae bacterium]|jgi:hypothetical protein|nr:hypothetical protein [Synergistaceae bacterium]
MKTQQQQRIYGFLIALTVILLVLAQVLLLQTLKKVTGDLIGAKNQVNSQKKTLNDRNALVSGYSKFTEALQLPGRQDASFPATELDLYNMVENIMIARSIEHTNTSASGGQNAPGSELRLRITFNGSYYNILKLLAEFRATQFVIRVADFSLSGQIDGKVSGSLTIISRIRS